MKSFRILLATWLAAGLGAVVGSILGGAVGRTGLFVGAAIGGMLGVTGAIRLLTFVRWLPTTDWLGAQFGGTGGFLIAVPIAVLNLDTPITPVMSCSLAGIGALFGIGVARGWRRDDSATPR